MKKSIIYTERIHHINCVVCDNFDSTNDMSHEMTKKAATAHFQSGGWVYIKRKGWHCGECASRETT